MPPDLQRREAIFDTQLKRQPPSIKTYALTSRQNQLASSRELLAIRPYPKSTTRLVAKSRLRMVRVCSSSPRGQGFERAGLRTAWTAFLHYLASNQDVVLASAQPSVLGCLLRLSELSCSCRIFCLAENQGDCMTSQVDEEPILQSFNERSAPFLVAGVVDCSGHHGGSQIFPNSRVRRC